MLQSTRRASVAIAADFWVVVLLANVFCVTPALAVPIVEKPAKSPAPVHTEAVRTVPSDPPGIHWFEIHADTPQERDEFLKKRTASEGTVKPREVPPLPQQRITPPTTRSQYSDH